MRLSHKVKFLASTARLLRSQWWDQGRIAAYQRDRLVSLLQYAVQNVPFYGRLGIRAADIKTIEDLQRFPVLTKADLQERCDEFLSQASDKGRLRHSRSSGMTGEPTITYFDDASWVLCKYALKARRVITTANSLRQRILIVSEQKSWPSAPALTSFLVKIRGITLTEDIRRNLQTVVQFQPNVIYGFPSYLLALADLAAATHVALPQVALICTSSEVLTQAARQSLEHAFRGSVVDVYGSTEFKEIAFQCVHGRYHVNFESVFVESVADAHGIPRLLVTTLVNKAMPLVRCELGDIGRVEQGQCPCGRSGPHVAGLNGRMGEILSFPDGTRMSAYALLVVMEQEPGVRYFRIVHEQPWILRIELLTPPAVFDASRRNLAAALAKILPTQASVKFLALADRGESTKRRVVSREF